MSNFDNGDAYAKRGPGRPKQIAEQAAVGLKKGKSSWTPASLNEFNNKEDGYRYRMSRKDPENLAKKAQEGWETVSAISSGDTQHVEPGSVGDAKPLTSVQEGRDWILQRIPEDLAQQRDEYFEGETRRRTDGLTAHIRQGMRDKGGNAPVHGEVTISSSRGTQIID